jgi:hypothetical protein
MHSIRHRETFSLSERVHRVVFCLYNTLRYFPSNLSLSLSLLLALSSFFHIGILVLTIIPTSLLHVYIDGVFLVTPRVAI